ncbi:MAG: ATP-binding protein [Betaproteobacteria bacterium]|nr:ATP-binding protein [Betaproteobacteria bacterium]
MIGKPLDQIDRPTIQALIDEEVTESKTLEYKRDFPGPAPEDKKKLLRTICALANTSGGDLVYGIEAVDGIAKAVPGIEVSSEDEIRLRLENAVRDGIEPRLGQLGLKLVPLASNQCVLVIRVEKSWGSPHRLKSDGHFYGRNSAGTYQLDIAEIRQGFGASETIIEKIRNFIAGRLLAIRSGETPVPIHKHGSMALHVVPVSAFSSDIRKPLNLKSTQLGPFDSRGWNSKFTLEGLATFNLHNQENSTYNLTFRSGVVESVAVFQPCSDGTLCLPASWLERNVVLQTKEVLDLLAKEEIGPPYYVFLSFVRIRGYELGRENNFGRAGHTLQDRDSIVLPEIAIDPAPSEAPYSIFQPTFDMLWNAFGYEKCFNYDNGGNWNGND